MFQHLGNPVFTFEEFMHCKQRSMVPAPEQIHPTGTVPQATKHHSYEIIEICAEASLARSTEWNVQIVAQPGAEGYMPSVPEFGGILRFERRTEIVLEPLAHKQGDTDGHIGITRKVAI